MSPTLDPKMQDPFFAAAPQFDSVSLPPMGRKARVYPTFRVKESAGNSLLPEFKSAAEVEKGLFTSIYLYYVRRAIGWGGLCRVRKRKYS